MLTTVKIWINQHRITATLRREENARKRVAIERLKLAQLEDDLERLELTAMTRNFYRDAGW